MEKDAIRDAASVILVRDIDGEARVLMGQRGRGAAFMPSKFVFPGGAVDPVDRDISLADPPDDLTRRRLGDLAVPLALCAIRELWEETGLLLGRPGDFPDTAPQEWAAFAERGLLPDGRTLRYVFRAITPPGRPRRFDARFFMINASSLASDPDDFSQASDELSHLQWVRPEDAQTLNLPFITEVVLAEVAALFQSDASPQSVPFFDNSTENSVFRRIA